MKDNEVITIGICTYKRPFLEKTLESLFSSTLETGYAVKIIIVDNDPLASAKSLVNSISPPEPFVIEYFCETSSGVVNARNRVLKEVDTEWLLFIDDDEIVDGLWLNSYLALIKDSGINFDAAVGPVITTYPEFVDQVIIDSKVLDRLPIKHLTIIKHGATGNCLINTKFVKRLGIKFDMFFNETGGEDSDFFERISEADGKIIWNANSVATEPLVQDRASQLWVKNRLFNNGRTYGNKKLMKKSFSYIPYLLTSSTIKLVFHSLHLVLSFNKPGKYFFYRCEIARDLGRLSSCFRK